MATGINDITKVFGKVGLESFTEGNKVIYFDSHVVHSAVHRLDRRVRGNN